MTVAIAVDKHRLDRAEQLQVLRRRIAAVSGKMNHGHSAPHPHDGLLPESQSLLKMPESLADLVPMGLPRGAVVVASGARSLPLAVIAGVTAAGGHAAIVGHPDIGLLAAVEMGADLTRVALIPDPGNDPVEVAAVLMDGMDLVVLGLGGRSVPMSRARAVMARARSKGCTLMVTDGDWQGAAMRLEAQVSGYEVTGARPRPVAGLGRISRVRLAVRACGRGLPLRASG
jgi:hypothetical protein